MRKTHMHGKAQARMGCEVCTDREREREVRVGGGRVALCLLSVTLGALFSCRHSAIARANTVLIKFLHVRLFGNCLAPN